MRKQDNDELFRGFISETEAYDMTDSSPQKSEHIDRKTVEKIAKLTNIQLSDGDIEHYQADLEKILTLFDALAKADTSGVDHLCLSPKADMEDLREDIPHPSEHVTDMGSFSPYFNEQNQQFTVVQVVQRSDDS
jgi:aspartyl/glutamyl-tRNA(Asn/Gln) amidotransferase C subunit